MVLLYQQRISLWWIISFSDVFVDKLPHFLPPERDAVHRIPLEPGHTPPYKRPYRISPKEMAELLKPVVGGLDNSSFYEAT